MKSFKTMMMLALLGFAVGCGGGPADNPVDVTTAPAADDIKLVLNEVIENGQPLGSQGYTLELKIGEIRETDPAKADQLQAAYEELRAMSKPAELKAKAKEMLEML